MQNQYLKERFMIKRYVLLFIASNVTSLYAILGGVGLNFAQDSFTLDQESIAESPVGSMIRTEMSEPIGFGGFAYLTLIPFVDFEVGANLTVAAYEYSYTNNITSDNETIELGLGKLTWHISAQRPLLKLPMIRMYAGAGINGSSYTKIVSEELVQNLDSDCFVISFRLPSQKSSFFADCISKTQKLKFEIFNFRAMENRPVRQESR